MCAGEFSCHLLLQQYALAPPIFGRFENGYVYGFVPGVVCSPPDLGREHVWRGVARKMAEWHASLPVDLFGSQSVSILSKEDIDFRVVSTAEHPNS
jgi:ethanolamine kinase